MTAQTWEGKLNELSWHVVTWIDAVFNGGNSRDNVMFAMFMAALSTTLGYGTAWLVYKRGRGGAGRRHLRRAAAAPPLVQLLHAELPLLPAPLLRDAAAGAPGAVAAPELLAERWSGRPGAGRPQRRGHQRRRHRAGADAGPPGAGRAAEPVDGAGLVALPGHLAARPEPHRPNVRRRPGAAGRRGRAGVRQHDAAARQLRAGHRPGPEDRGAALALLAHHELRRLHRAGHGQRRRLRRPLRGRRAAADPVRRNRGPRGDGAAHHRPGEPVEPGLRLGRADQGRRPNA